MLPDRLSQLLTAYIDGEVSARQRKAIQHLLHQSAEARALLGQLQEDARQLRRLPRHRLEADFSGRVLLTISERRLHHGRRPPVSTPRPAFPAWVSLAVAASVLLMIGVGSYLYFEAAQQYAEQMAAKKNAEENSPPEKELPAGPSTAVAKQPDQPTALKRPVDEPPNPTANVAQSNPQPPSLPQGPLPEPLRQPRGSSTLAVPNSRIKELEEAPPPTVALSLPVRSLDRNESRQRLRKELRPDQGYRLELACLDKAKALDHLQGALKSHGIRLLMDQEAQVRLKNRRLKTDYALYTEGIFVEELAKILEHLGRIDKQAEAKKRGDGQFDQVLILSLTADDRKDLATLLGVDPLHPLPAKPKAPLGVDIRQPISTGTAAQVSQSLAGQGTPRPEPGKPVTVKLPERLALVVPYAPVRTKPTASKEIKQFLDGRKERQPGTVQMFLVLGSVNGH
jgi:hypothetical protein